jgi:hypothetical protein
MYEFDEQKSAGLLSKLLSEPSKNVVPTHPLMLVCSKYMHAFPWELILPAAPVVRCSILDDLLTAENQRVRILFNCLCSFSCDSFIHLTLAQGIKEVQEEDYCTSVLNRNHATELLLFFGRKVN